MGLPTYVTREELAAAADVKSSAGIAAQLDRILRGASRSIDERFHRHFYPLTATYTFEPDGFTDPEFHEWGFWLDRDILSVASITADGDSVATYTLQPQRYGPPYGQIFISAASVIVIAGEWGYTNETVSAGAAASALTDATGTALTVTDSSKLGIGDLFTIDSERFIVEAKANADTGAVLDANLGAVASEDAVTLDDGSLVLPGEMIQLDSEKMRVLEVTGNVASVVRAVDGSTLAAHTGAVTVYAPRALTVERGATGSTAATHSTAVAISRHVAPGPIRDLVLAEALTALEQERSGYARIIGSGEGAREAAGKALADVRAQADVYRRWRSAAAV